MIERLRYLMVMLFLMVLGKGIAYAQFNPTNPPEPDVPPTTYKVRVTASPAEAAYVYGAGDYTEGTQVRIRTSQRSSNYVFQYWTKDSVKYSDNASFYYTVGKEDAAFVAVYKFNPSSPVEPETDNRYELCLKAEPESSCSFNRTSGVKVKAGERVNIKAYGNQGYVFQGWYNGDSLISSSTSFYFTMPEQKTTLVAKYVYNPSSPGDPSNDGGQTDVDLGSIEGDVNKDREVLIDDVVLVINYLLGENKDSYVVKVADLNADGLILIDDVVLLINKILAVDSKNMSPMSSRLSETDLIVEGKMVAGGAELAVRLDDAASYTAMQFDMDIPAAVSIGDVRIVSTTSHGVAFRSMETGVIRVVVTSLTNEALNENSKVCISLNATKASNISITNAFAATARGQLATIADVNASLDSITGIQRVETRAKASAIYDMHGRLVRKSATVADGLRKGIYLMNGKKVVMGGLEN